MPIPNDLTTLTKAHLQALIDDKIQESYEMEYKAELHLVSDQNKNEFRADVTAFANARGGHIVVGVREERGLPVELVGQSIGDIDAFKGTVDQVLQSHVRPRVPGCIIWPVPLSKGKTAIVIRVPNSFAKPHEVLWLGTKDDFRFYARNNHGKARLDVEDLRSIILQSEGLQERIRRFREDRIARIMAGDTPVPLAGHARLVLHVIPLPTFAHNQSTDLRNLQHLGAEKMPVCWGGDYIRRFNFDGYLMFGPSSTGSGRMVTCLQVFRNGTIEMVDARMLELTVLPDDGDRKGWHLAWEERLCSALDRACNLLGVLGLSLPCLAFVALLGVKGHVVVPPDVDQIPRGNMGYPLGRDTMLLPDILVDGSDVPADVRLRPVFDAIWNEAGFPEDPYYDTNGRLTDCTAKKPR